MPGAGDTRPTSRPILLVVIRSTARSVASRFRAEKRILPACGRFVRQRFPYRHGRRCAAWSRTMARIRSASSHSRCGCNPPPRAHRAGDRAAGLRRTRGVAEQQPGRSTGRLIGSRSERTPFRAGSRARCWYRHADCATELRHGFRPGSRYFSALPRNHAGNPGLWAG